MRLITFQLRCEPNRPEYFEVRVYPSLALLRRAIRRHDRSANFGPFPRDMWSRCEGLCRTVTVLEVQKGRRARILPRLGWLFFAETSVGAGVVSHEMTHAAIYFARRARLRLRHIFPVPDAKYVPTTLTPEDGERFCHIVGRLTAGFYEKLQDLGHWKRLRRLNTR